MFSADTNLFLYAANPASPQHAAARAFFDSQAKNSSFIVCELVLVELYLQLRNPAVLRKPLTSAQAAGFCRALKSHPVWQHVDYVSEVSAPLWNWASQGEPGFRQVIDARLALTLLHHGVSQFATANVKDFLPFGFAKVWNPVGTV
jgi:toxin-antitoxin system PIN domain toxin